MHSSYIMLHENGFSGQSSWTFSAVRHVFVALFVGESNYQIITRPLADALEGALRGRKTR